jgi:hypothetical protein
MTDPQTDWENQPTLEEWEAHDHYLDKDVELCVECGHPTDNHDRRAEDGDCLDCTRDGVCSKPSMVGW